MKRFTQITVWSAKVLFCCALLWMGSCKKNEGLESETQLAIESFYPNSGKAGTLVTILGSGFSTDREVNKVTFGGVDAEVISAQSDRLVVRAPVGGNTGNIVLSKQSRTLTVGAYTYQSLSVQELSPARAQQGGQISILGEGFGSLESLPVVTINGKEARVVSVTETVLEVIVPEAAGSGPVRVSVDGQEAQGPNLIFMVINSIKPLTGGAGTHITIEGEGFGNEVATNAITINGQDGEVLEASENRLVVRAPVGVETGQLVVEVEDHPIQGPLFTVVPLPGIQSVSPLSGPAGTEMVIVGSTFSPEPDETIVRINGHEMAISSVTESEIRLTLPGGTGSGKVEVIVNDQLTEGPIFKDQNLGILALYPDNGLAGTEVTITGTGFSSSIGENLVTFNGVNATVISASENSVTVVAPPEVTTGVLRISTGGYEADAPVEFRRAGVVTIGYGQLSVSTGGSLAVDANGNVYVLEIASHRIKKVTADGQVSLFVGSESGQQGYQNGSGSAALFRLTANAGLVVDEQEHLYLTDPGNQSLRKIDPSGLVSTFLDGFGGDIGKIAIRNNGELYFPGASGALWRISPSTRTGMQLSIQSTTDLSMRHGVDDAGSFYMRRTSSTYLHRISRYLGTTWSHTTTWAGGSSAGHVDASGGTARFNHIYGMVRYDADHILVLDANNRALRLANTTTAAISTLLSFSQGYVDGDFRAARFSNTLRDINIAPDGTVYILDSGNNAVRKVFFR